MLVASTHAVPVCLFELQDGNEAQYAGASENAPSPAVVCGTDHHPALLRQLFNGGNEARTCRRSITTSVETDRFGPGRLSRRRRQTVRLRELRARRSAGPTRDTDVFSLSRELTNGQLSVQEWTRDESKGNDGIKRDRGPPRNTEDIRQQNALTNSSVAVVSREDTLLVAHATSVTGVIDMAQTSANGDNECVEGNFVGKEQDNLGLNPSTFGHRCWRKGKAGSRRGVHSTVDRWASFASLDSRASVCSGSTVLPTPNSQIASALSAIHPVRSAPVPLRSRVSTARNMLRSSGEHKQDTIVLQPLSNDGQQFYAEANFVATARGSDTHASAAENSGDSMNATGAGNGDVSAQMTGPLAQSKLTFPGVADACGGIILRLSPAERPLDPWNTKSAPLRAMCDIEPSLSRAGITYRGVIHAVEAAQEFRSHDKIKRKLVGDAKSLLGRDVRPRTSEPRLRVAGVTTELDVLKTIIVRERLIVTLRRLIRRLRRHCHKLQGCLRREAKFRWRHAKFAPDAVACATAIARKTLHTEQQELRVVLAHLRVISIDTVNAVAEWRATLVVNEKPGYRQLPSAAYFPSPQGVSHAATTLFDLSEAQGTHYNNVVCAGEDKTNQHECTEPSVLHGRNSVLSGQSREDNSTATDTGRNASAVAEEGKTNMKQFHKSNKKSNNGNNPATFRWKGQNYLQKMAHDLEFLDDATVSAPVSAWLGFSVRDNPFLIPPDDHDVCGALRRQHEQRRKASASRRRQQPRRDSNGRRRSHSRAHPNSSAGASGDVFAACPAPEEAPLTVLEFDSRSRMSVEERRTKTPAGCGNNSGFEMTEASLGSMSASIDPLLQGLTDLEEEVISCELSSGEEEEVRWDGGGQLDAPLVPSLPECVCRKAAAAAEILSSERASQHLLEQKVRGILANARRAKQILHVPRAQYSSRLESLALRSAREGLRGALKDRHVGTTKFQSMSVEAFGSEAGHLTRVSTAPANGVGQHGREAIATTTGSGHSGRSPVFSRRGGMRVFADGWTADMATEDGDGGANRSCGASNTSNTMIIGLARSSSLAFARAIGLNHNELPAWSISFCHLSAQGPSTAHLPYLKQIDSVAAEGTTSIPSTAERSAEWSSEQSTAASSLQASSSSMSAHAHAKAVAARPTATRRARRNGGKIIVMDPAKSPETSGRAADLIQAAFLATRARSYVRRLQAQREGATTLIGRIWRGCRVRLVIRTENRLRRAEELRNRVQNRMRTRAAHLITIFFRDIVYRRRRDRRALFLRDRERITREIQEQVAAVMIQCNIRRFQALVRTNNMRQDRRGYAQARIARAVRARAAYLRQKELEQQRREEETVAMKENMRPKALVADEAASRMQAWLRGMYSRRTVAAIQGVAVHSSPEKHQFGQGNTRAALQAALSALENAQSMARSNGGDAQRRTVADRTLADKNPRQNDLNGPADGPASPRQPPLRARIAERRNTPSRAKSRHKTSC